MYTIYCPGAQPGLEAADQACVYDLNEEGLTKGEVGVARERADAQMSLLKDIGGLLEEVEAVFYSHDVPWQFVGHEYVSGRELRLVRITTEAERPGAELSAPTQSISAGNLKPRADSYPVACGSECDTSETVHLHQSIH